MTNESGPPSHPPHGQQQYGPQQYEQQQYEQQPYGPQPYDAVQYGPPPYQPPPYGPPPSGPPRGSSSATVVTVLLAVAFVAATALAAWGVHDHDSSSSAGSRAVVPQQSGGVPAAASGSYRQPVPSGYLSSPSTSSYVPPPPPSTPTPTRVPLSPETINRTFQVYMNALLNRSLSQLKLATCPKLRHTETGTALDRKYINRWQAYSYRIYDSLDYVTIRAKVRYVNPNTGGNGKSHVYSWYVTRYPDGHYWVCGFFG